MLVQPYTVVGRTTRQYTCGRHGMNQGPRESKLNRSVITNTWFSLTLHEFKELCVCVPVYVLVL
jgi:hypothetical protein